MQAVGRDLEHVVSCHFEYGPELRNDTKKFAKALDSQKGIQYVSQCADLSRSPFFVSEHCDSKRMDEMVDKIGKLNDILTESLRDEVVFDKKREDQLVEKWQKHETERREVQIKVEKERSEILEGAAERKRAVLERFGV